MALDDVYILSLRQSLFGQQVVNTMALRCKVAPDPTAADFQTFADNVRLGLRTFQVDDLSYTDWVALKVRGAGVTYATSAPFRVSTVSFSGPFPGGSTGMELSPPGAPNAAIVLAVITAQSGRRRKGRMFIAGVSEAAIDNDGTLADSVRTGTIETWRSGHVAYAAVGGTSPVFEQGVWSDRIAMNVALSNTWPRVRVSQGAPDPASAYAGMVNLICRDYIGSQRDRRPGI